MLVVSSLPRPDPSLLVSIYIWDPRGKVIEACLPHYYYITNKMLSQNQRETLNSTTSTPPPIPQQKPLPSKKTRSSFTCIRQRQKKMQCHVLASSSRIGIFASRSETLHHTPP